jgi:hypothetical protein
MSTAGGFGVGRGVGRAVVRGEGRGVGVGGRGVIGISEGSDFITLGPENGEGGDVRIGVAEPIPLCVENRFKTVPPQLVLFTFCTSNSANNHSMPTNK